MKIIFLTITLLLSLSCTKSSNDEVYSLPYWKDNDSAPLKRIVVAVSNNEEGKLKSEHSPVPNQILRPGFPSSIKFGGPNFLSGYINILRKRYGENLVLLDSGRFLKTSSNAEDKTALLKFYKHLKYDGVLFTEEEVIHYLSGNKQIKMSGLSFINSNIIDLRTKKLLTKDIIADYKLLEKNGLKIGIIGLTSYEGRKIISHDTFKGIYFEKPALTFLEYKNKLKKKGADIIILMASLKTNCKSKLPPRTLNSPRPSWAKIYCQDKKDNLLRFLKRIPRGSLDLLVLSNSKTQLRGFLMDTPVVTTPPSSGYLRMVEIFYDTDNKKLVWDRSLLYPKIQLCQSFFRVTSDCYLGANLPGYADRLQKLKRSALQIKPAMFLGHEVKPDLSVNSFLPIMR